jgi:hypothetical protein
MKCALVLNGVVESIKELSSEEIQSLATHYETILEIDDMNPEPQVGWVFDGDELKDPSAQATAKRHITRGAFRSRFTIAERAGLYALAQTDIIARVLIDDLTCAKYADLDGQDEQNAIGYLMMNAILTEERAGEILSAEIKPEERYEE